MVLVFSWYLYLARKYHKREFRESKFYILLFVGLLTLIGIAGVFLEAVFYKDLKEIEDYLHKGIFYVYNEQTQLIVMVDFIKWTVIPAVILLFKKNQDMFCCFSKID